MEAERLMHNCSYTRQVISELGENCSHIVGYMHEHNIQWQWLGEWVVGRGFNMNLVTGKN